MLNNPVNLGLQHLISIQQEYKMTIYIFELKPNTLANLPFYRHIVDISLEIYQHISTYFQEVILNENEHAQLEVSSQDFCMHWVLSALKNSTSEDSDEGYDIKVSAVSVIKQAQRFDPKYRQGFTLTSLSGVHPKVLYAVMAQLLTDALIVLVSQAHSLSLPQKRRCIEIAKTALQSICKVLNQHLDENGSNVQFDRKINLCSIKLKVELCNQIDEIKIL